MEVMGLYNNLLDCKILSGDRAGQGEYIPRITLDKEGEYNFVLSRHQFPVKLAFCMTINKSQGQTLEKVGLDLRTQVFSHGQLYVAFSRVRAWDGIVVKLPPENEDRVVKNVVYKEIL
jgi:ATP-dependent exoDNAse (exonuclease V) alpha subunit